MNASWKSCLITHKTPKLLLSVQAAAMYNVLNEIVGSMGDLPVSKVVKRVMGNVATANTSTVHVGVNDTRNGAKIMLSSAKVLVEYFQL